MAIFGVPSTVTRGGAIYTMDTAGIGKRSNGTAIHDGSGWHRAADPEMERLTAAPWPA